MAEEESLATIKLAVHVAETGHYFELNCPASTPVHILQTCIASAVHVKPQDQLLLCAHMRLEPQRTLASYRLASEQQKVFLFNRVRLLAGAPPPSPEHLPIKQLSLPPVPTTSVLSHPLSDVADPTAHVLPSYVTQFCYHFQKGSAIYACSRDKLELCKRLCREQQVQSLALDAAKSSMNHFYKIIEQSQQDFMKRFNAQHKLHASMLINLDRDLERLRACKLHPRLVSKGRTTLLDCLDEPNLRKQVGACTNSHKQFHEKVMQLKASHTELHRSVQELFDITPAMDPQKLEQLITENVRIVEEQHVILQSLSKDMETANHHSSGSLRPHDAIAALGPMYDVHEKNHLPKIEAYHKKLEKLLDFVRAKKHEMSVCVHTCMQRVAALQSSIRDLRNQLSAFSEALSHQDDLFSDLKLVRRIGPVYRACLAEVVRRKGSMKLYMGQAGQLAERMAKKRAVEVAHRDEFLRAQSAFLPRDLLLSMGLSGHPSQCVVNIEPYDTDLLDLDVGDLEKYAPESLFGPHLMGFAASNLLPLDDGHLHSTDLEETAQTNPTMEAIEDMSTEIAGTSKLEVENAWLKAEYASAIALLCSLDFEFESHAPNEGDESQQNSESLAAKRTLEALALKDEHAKHLQSMLNASQLQCSSYEKRIRELEQRLSDQYNQLHGLSSDRYMASPDEAEMSVITGEAKMSNTESAFELMDEGVSGSFPVDARKSVVSNDNSRAEQTLEGGDESMGDFLGGSMAKDTACDTQREGVRSGHLQPTGSRSLEKEIMCLTAEHKGTKDEQLTGLQEAVLQTGSRCAATEHKGIKDEQLAGLQEAVLQTGSGCAAAEERLKAALEESACLREELRKKTAILNECYMNCAELESNLLLAREEARTNQCLANRKAAEYSSLRASSVKLRGLVERLRHCVFTSETGLPESLQAFSDSLNSNDNKDDITQEFGRCVHTLADRVGRLVQKQSRLVDPTDGISNYGSAAELKTRMDFFKEQYERHKMNKQV